MGVLGRDKGRGVDNLKSPPEIHFRQKKCNPTFLLDPDLDNFCAEAK